MDTEKIHILQEQVLNAALTCVKKGVIHGTSGNISMADEEKKYAVITPSNIPYEALKPEDLPVVRISDGDWVKGNYKPSSETPMHTAILRAKPKMFAVVHTHALYSTVMSLCVDEIPCVAAASSPYTPVKVAPFDLPGSDAIAEGAVKVMGKNCVVLLKNHGLIATGPSLDVAMMVAEYTEENTQTAYLAQLAGKMTAVPEESYKIMHDRAAIRLGLYEE